jgi:hypothetical protein
MDRLKYDGLPEGAHTFTYTEKTRAGKLVRTGYQNGIKRGDVIEVADLNDPESPRARICRGHVERGVAHVIEPKPKRKTGSK